MSSMAEFGSMRAATTATRRLAVQRHKRTKPLGLLWRACAALILFSYLSVKAEDQTSHYTQPYAPRQAPTTPSSYAQDANLFSPPAHHNQPQYPSTDLNLNLNINHQQQQQTHEYESSSCIITLNRTNLVAPTQHGPHAASYQAQQQQVCITEQDVEWALEGGKSSLLQAGSPFATDSPIWRSPELAASATSPAEAKSVQLMAVARVVMEATRLLALRFQLSETEVLFGLPSIDATNSPAIARICPHFLRDDQDYHQHAKLCPEEGPGQRYRSLSGYCNNRKERSWGAAGSAMVRFLEPDYQDAIWMPRLAYDGSPLPSPRVVSFVVHQDVPECDQTHSLLGVVWGQFINHDINLGAKTVDEIEEFRQMDCCKQTEGRSQMTDCFPIEIPKGDPFFGYFREKCMNFVRLAGGPQPACSLGPVQAMNRHSSYLDGSSIYGSDAATLARLRTFKRGQLKSQAVAQMPALDYPAGSNQLTVAASASAGAHSTLEPLFKDLLPPKTKAPDAGCERRGRSKQVYCFDAGDGRANEQIQLASLHTVWMREHNRLARALAQLNPHWSDRRLFEEARAIVAAQVQHITYSEFLPLVVGRRHLVEHGLVLEPIGSHFHGYDPKINTGIRAEFQAAAFRFGHSLVPSEVLRFNKFHQQIESIRLSKLLKQPFDLYYPGVLDTYLLGLVDQPAGLMDPALTSEIANHLFERPGNLFGLDLAAINIQRAREMGIRGYNAYREHCGLGRARDFADLRAAFSNRTLARMTQLYRHVDDVDLFTGGLSELPTDEDALVGPTFACLIAEQFSVLRRGDRFWYENGARGRAGPQFTLEQLDEIRRQTAARLLCDNADDLEDIQAHAMLVPDPHTNPRVPCRSLPAMDLTKWREPVVATSAYGQQPQPREQQQQPVAAPALSMRLDYETLAEQLLVDSNRLQSGTDPLAAYHQCAHQPDTMKSGGHFVDHLVLVSNFPPLGPAGNVERERAGA